MTERPQMPSPPYTGKCLCGAVHWQLTSRPIGINACHCQDCKKLTGATNALMLFGLRADLQFEGPTQTYRKVADSGREIDIVRCATCGTRLWHEPLAAPTLAFIAAGTLDDTSWAVPASHIYVASASPCVTFQDDAVLVDGPPPAREILTDAFKALYPQDAS